MAVFGMTKISPHHAVYIGDSTSKHIKPPLSYEALYAIHKVGVELNGEGYRPWQPEYRQAIYDARHRTPEPEPDPSLRRCRDCGVITKGRTLCAPCQHIRDPGTPTYGRTCCDCGEPVARNHAHVIRCPPCQERTNQEFNRLKAERQRTRRQGVPA